MASTYTLAEMAEIIGKLDKLAPDSPEQATLHRQVRNLKSKGLIVPTQTLDARGTGGFDTLALYRARLFTVLYSVGFDAQRFDRLDRELEIAANSLSLDAFVAPSQRIEGGAIFHGGLLDAIRGIELGEAWDLTIRKQAPRVPGLKSEIVMIHHRDNTGAITPLPAEFAQELYRFTVSLNEVFEGLPALGDA